MKRGLSLIILLFVSTILFAQVSKTVNCTAGGLNSLLTAAEKNTVTDLTITGVIDARDFKTMRDSMAVISVVDMSSVTVLAYSGTLGTQGASNYSYQDNSIPKNAFSKQPWKAGLTSFTFPFSITTIDDFAFQNCTGLNTITIPSLVTTIGASAFENCDGLIFISIPTSVTTIESSSAFAYSTGDIIVSESNPNYSSIEGVLFNKDKTILMHCPASKTGEYIIPSTVTSLSDYAFGNCFNLTNISIPSVVTTIGCNAFYQCIKLTSIVLPPTITKIERYTFEMCQKLTSILIPPLVTSIGYNAFWDCRSLTTITIPTSVSSIEGGAFSNCLALTSIYADSPSPVDLSSSPDVFKGINTTTCKLYVPYLTKEAYDIANQWKDFTTIIERQGFNLPDNRVDLLSTDGSKDSLVIFANVSWSLSKDQTWLTLNTTSGTGNDTLVITANANPDYTDRKATVIVSATNVPSQTITIVQYGIPQIFHVTAGGLSNVLTSDEKSTISNLKLEGTIDARDFKTMRDSMPALSNIDLCNAAISSYTGTLGTSGTSRIIYSANVIPDYAFCTPVTLIGKNTLISVQLPSSITSIGKYAYYGCSNIELLSITSPITKIDDYSFYGCKNLNSFYLPSSLTSIGNYSFYGCKELTSIINNSMITSIGNYAFAECSSLISFMFPSTLTTIGYYAFSNCKRLTSISIPSLVTSIGSSSFNGCCHLKSAIITSPLTTIPNGLFYGCSDLTSFTIPLSVTSIGGSAFRYCSSLTSITIPSLVLSIESYAFNNCSGLTSISIPSAVASIGYSAFAHCSELTSVVLPPLITDINEYTFYYCSKLTSVNIPPLVKSIKKQAFQKCNIKTIEIPSSVTTIGNDVFMSCDSLTSITIPTSVTSIGEGVFMDCTSLLTIEIPNSVSRLEKFLFAWDQFTSFTIPSSVTYIGSLTFYMCTHLISLKCENAIPVDVINSSEVFSGVNKSSCKLYVPYGSKGLYAAANQWKDFQHIVEMPGISLSEDTINIASILGSSDSVIISSNTTWAASSDQTWLSVTPAMGTGNDTLIFTARSNPTTLPRTALITISGDSIKSDTITIIQEARTGTTIPFITEVTDTIISNSEIACFNAYDTIFVAGTDTVTFENGSTVDFIAGSTIRFLPGFHALEGSVAHAWITTDGTFCDGASGSIVQTPQVEKSGDAGIDFATGKVYGNELKVYPNPNSGKFTIELLKVEAEDKADAKVEIEAEVKVYNALGETVYQAEMQDRQSTIDLTGMRRGLYVVMVTDGQERFMRKVMVE